MTRLAAVLLVIAVSNLVVPLRAEQPAAKPAEIVEIPLNPLPFILKGAVRRPEGRGPFPAIILLPACGNLATSVNQVWGQALLSWGYVTLTLDVFTPRGIAGQKTCLQPAPPELAEDVYRGLKLLVARKDVDPKQVFVIGFGRSSTLVLAAIERDGIERDARHRFLGAVVVYPQFCGAANGNVTVATLVMIGARDPQLDACRKLAAGEDDMGISRTPNAGMPMRLETIANAYPGFDLLPFQKPADIQGHHYEYSQSATDQAKETLRTFLRSTARRP